LVWDILENVAVSETVHLGCNKFSQFVPYALSFNLPGKPDATDSRLMVSNIGMSSIGISIEQFLAHEHSSTEEIKYFQRE
jgi:hypothetical protein